MSTNANNTPTVKAVFECIRCVRNPVILCSSLINHQLDVNGNKIPRSRKGPVPLSIAPHPETLQCHSGPESQRVWEFSCRFSGSDWNKPPQIWRWSEWSARGNIRKPPEPVLRGCSARRSCACAWTRWQSWCRSWAWWLTRPCSRWRTPRPCWQERDRRQIKKKKRGEGI